MKLSRNRLLGIGGGTMTVISAVLPWAVVNGGAQPPGREFIGLAVGYGGIGVFVTGLLGAVCLAVPRPVTVKLGLVLGVLALVLGLLTLVGINATAAIVGGGASAAPEYGVFVALVGAVLLMTGSLLAVRKGEADSKAAPTPYR